MRIAQILLAAAAIALISGVRPARADEGWLGKLNPFDGSASSQSSPKKSGPSALEKVGTGTKKFFTDTVNVLTFQKPAPKPRPTNQYTPWLPQPTPRAKSEKKGSWLDSLFKPKEPERVETLRDWVGLPRLDP